MNENPDLIVNDRWIVSNRGRKNSVDPQKPYGWLVEKERTSTGEIEDAATIFLTNRECPFHCLMCDLWKNTTDFSIPSGAIPNQIEFALRNLPDVKNLKLYNSGSFFDERAIPEEDYGRIASLIQGFETVIVESHPRFITEKCLKFRDMLKPELQVAIGLETVHSEVLRKLNKKMTLEDFSNSVRYLKQHAIRSRAFILLGPPFHSEADGIYWAERSIDFAFDAGVECCIVIPVRADNGAMELLMKRDDFHLPDIISLENVLEYGIRLKAGRIIADVWDLGLFSSCEKCINQRTNRLIEMNLNQKISEPVKCSCN